jgi:DNA-binding NtrC family response regulator
VERAVVLSSQELMDVDLLPESVRTKEILGGVRLHLSEFVSLAANASARSFNASARREPPVPGELGAHTGADSSNPSLFQIMDEIERRIICDMLERTGWNQTEAAEQFQVPLSTLNQKIKRLGIDTRRRGSGRTGGDEPVVSAAGK